MDHTGQQLGNYRLTHLLGKGGFADVYLGEHIFLRTFAAIKVLHTQLTEDSMSGFLTEAQTIGRLRHPNIIRVLDFGVHENTPYLVMDYAPQGTLRQLHPKGSRLPLPTVVHYVKQVAEALHYAHGEKFIHRDIKPENMLLGSNNEILLSDFGIATMAQSSRYQMTQDVVGTVAYMAPEQIQGKPRPVSDEYALGIVIYEWLTGSYPFHGTFTEIASQHVFATVPPLREKLPTLPEDVEQVISMALAKDPQQRFATLRAFANALAQASGKVSPDVSTFIPSANTDSTITPVLFQGELPTFISPSHTGPMRISAPEPVILAAVEQGTLLPTPTPSPPPNGDTSPTKGNKSERRYTRRMLLGGVGGLVIIGGSAAAWLAMTNNLPFSHAYSPTPTATTLAGTTPSTPAPTATNTTGPTPTATSQPTATPTAPATPPPISPAILTYDGPDSMYTAAWSPNGAWIASAGHGPLVEVWATTSKSPLFSYNGGSQKVFSAAWSPSGSRIASGHSDGSVQIWDIASRSRVFYQKGHSNQVNSVAWSLDGAYIVSGSGDKTAKVWDANTGSLLLTYTGHAHYVNSVAWSHSGSYIASGSGDNTAQIWAVAGGQLVSTYTGHSDVVLAVAWSPDDAYIVSGSKDNTAQVWSPANGNLSFTYRGHTNYVLSCAWSPDGTLIVSGSTDHTAQVWGASNGTHYRDYTGHTDQVESVAWSSNSTEVVSASDDWTVQIWKAMG
ncbi:MAG: serine/threonine-protein kinase [Ktedonobacteraceae bacterium]